MKAGHIMSLIEVGPLLWVIAICMVYKWTNVYADIGDPLSKWIAEGIIICGAFVGIGVGVYGINLYDQGRPHAEEYICIGLLLTLFWSITARHLGKKYSTQRNQTN